MQGAVESSSVCVGGAKLAAAMKHQVTSKLCFLFSNLIHEFSTSNIIFPLTVWFLSQRSFLMTSQLSAL